MANKTCGECKNFFLNSEGHCKSNDGSENAHNDACSFFEQKVITNGDKIRQSGNRALAQFAYMSLRICQMCTFSQLEEGRYECTAEHGQSCIDGIEAWLNAPAEKTALEKAIDIHEEAYLEGINAPAESEMNNG